MGFSGILFRTSLPPLGLFLMASSSIVPIRVAKKDNTTALIVFDTLKRNIRSLFSLLIPYIVHRYRILRLDLLLLFHYLYVHITRIDISLYLWRCFLHIILFKQFIQCICINAINKPYRHRSTVFHIEFC